MKTGEFNSIIKKVIKDCRQFGLNFEVVGVRDRETKQFVDYELIKRDTNFIDEDNVRINLFRLLAIFIYQNNPTPLPRYSCYLTALRKILGVTQKTFSEVLEVTPFELSCWERGKIEPPYEVVLYMESIFGIDLSDYLQDN